MTSVNVDVSSVVSPPHFLQTGVVVTDKQLCTSCSARSHDRFFIYNTKGARGSAYGSVGTFYGVNFCAVTENFGAYVCRSCRNTIQQYDSCQKKLLTLHQKLHSNRQQLITLNVGAQSSSTASNAPSISSEAQQLKEGVEHVEHPCACGKRPSCAEVTSAASPAKPTQKRTTFLQDTQDTLVQYVKSESEDQNNMLPLPVKSESEDQNNMLPLPCFPLLMASANSNGTGVGTEGRVPMPNSDPGAHKHTPTSCEKPRTQTITFRSVQLYKGLHHIARLLQGGSVVKVVHALYRYNKQMFTKAVGQLCKCEGTTVAKEDNSAALRIISSTYDVLSTNMDFVEDTIRRNAPLTWGVLHSFGTNRKGDYNVSHIRAAALILAHSRSSRLNRFQLLNSLALYQFDLRKEGFNYLSTLGVVCHPTTLYAHLRDVESSGQKIATSQRRRDCDIHEKVRSINH